MYDYHVHTTFSDDASLEMEVAIKRAIQMGIKEIVFTDHAELSVWRPNGLIVDDLFDIPSYIEILYKYKEKYKDKISIKLGIEIGLQIEEKERINQLVNEYSFDFVIGSSHTIDKYDLYFRNLFENKTKEEAYERYFKEVRKIVEKIDSYNVYGHLDVVRRYAYTEYEDININNIEREMIEEILKIIIQKGKGIEVNTSGFRYGIKSTNPDIDILSLYKSLGGEIITVGSDAHKEEDIGYKILETYDLLRDIGYRYITTFEKMEPKFVRL
ncbi:histidinol-phosphatase HisJ family protein [Crassaminicella thermophila]|uniref:Histidinol-phosphatase n=1 Tax=Crassaminicella thermophila TaxID=2599308 RepID=A0A5C0SDU9_CRATE|nr:histidinol-phosphatase HisJ family protein [Crassaminicella thermophila]QEK11434.1 histidinol-phosphatase HisJ family protein [Crassaminicella thermophila]